MASVVWRVTVCVWQRHNPLKAPRFVSRQHRVASVRLPREPGLMHINPIMIPPLRRPPCCFMMTLQQYSCFHSQHANSSQPHFSDVSVLDFVSQLLGGSGAERGSCWHCDVASPRFCRLSFHFTLDRSRTHVICSGAAGARSEVMTST